MQLRKIIQEDFQSTLANLAQSDVPVKTAFKIKKIVEKVNEKHEEYENKRLKLVNELGDKNKDNELKTNEDGQAQFNKQNWKKFTDALVDLQSSDIDVGTIHIDDLEGINITAKDLLALGDVVVDD